MSDANRLNKQLQEIIDSTNSSREIKKAFTARLQEGKLTREENQYSHFTVYFAAFDPKAKKVFIGHHKKSGLWLFNGGHIEKGELPGDAVIREIDEEWGIPVPQIQKPDLLTLTKIEHPDTQICEWHYDIWYFFALDKKTFHPDTNLLAIEFYQIGWKSLHQARALARDLSTLTALDLLAR